MTRSLTVAARKEKVAGGIEGVAARKERVAGRISGGPG
jgi:hypothetical protein